MYFIYIALIATLKDTLQSFIKRNPHTKHQNTKRVLTWDLNMDKLVQCSCSRAAVCWNKSATKKGFLSEFPAKITNLFANYEDICPDTCHARQDAVEVKETQVGHYLIAN